MFDCNSFWVNVIAGLPYFVLGVILTIYFIPKITVSRLRKQNKEEWLYILSNVVLELSFFLQKSPYRHNEEKKLYVYAKTKSPIPEIITVLPGDVRSEIYFLKFKTKVLNYFKGESSQELMQRIEKENLRVSKLRIELEKILSSHSVIVDTELISQISKLSLAIRRHEISFSDNLMYKKLIQNTGKQREGIFGHLEIVDVVEKVFQVLNKITTTKDFIFTTKPIVKKNNKQFGALES